MIKRQYRIDLRTASDLQAFITAFNDGLIREAGGHWNGNWNAFHDYLSWPSEDSYDLILDGWLDCHALDRSDVSIFEDILASNPHVSVLKS